MAVEMELSKIIISDTGHDQIIVLKEVHGNRKFPIIIGHFEAQAIDRRLKGIFLPRPQTHDLLASVIEHLGGTLERIEIRDLENATFFASLHIRQNGQIVEVDCRPSDAIALGITSGTTIWVAEHVLEAAG